MEPSSPDSGGDVIFNFPEWQASTCTVDCTGTRAVLAVQKWLAVVSLNRSEANNEQPKILRKLNRQNKYEIKAVLWNPHPAQKDLLASTCQQKVEVWDVNAERHPQLYSIKAHTRPVSDLSWSFVDPNLLASCAVDSFVHIWDIRESRRPKTSFKAVAGASLVQWNRVSGNIIASAHDSDIRIWDLRKPSTASGYITAHMSRIHDLDWSHTHQEQLTTCSHDSSIKFWDTLSPREPLSAIKAGAQPLWRARNYPTGQGVAMVLVPAMHSGDSRVFLWGRSNVSSPLHVFAGHSEPVLEVQWCRALGGYQLVTLSRDRTVRIWSLNEQLRQDLGGGGQDHVISSAEAEDEEDLVQLSNSGEPSITSLSTSEAEAKNNDSQSSASTATKPAPVMEAETSFMGEHSWGRPSPTKSSPLLANKFQPQTAHTLSQEFSLLNLDNVPNLVIERLEASQRSCTVKVEQGGHLVRVGVTFPAHYPNGAAPSFTFDKSTSIDISSQQELNKTISDTALSFVKFNRPCLEQCLRKLARTFESFVSRPLPPSKQPDFDITFGHLDDEHIPFPRTSGARFCANGLLVCFNCPPGLALPSDAAKTPRSLDKMTSYRSHIRPVVRGQARGWSGYLSSSLPKRGSGANLMQMGVAAASARDKPTSSLFAGDKVLNPFTGLVTVHDFSCMLPIDYTLARTYTVTGSDLAELCALNGSAAEQSGRIDLLQAWSTAALIADTALQPPPDADAGVPWSQHPFGRELIHSLFDHYGRLHDVQTLAMLACVFQKHCLELEATKLSTSHHPRTPSPTKRVPHPSHYGGRGPPSPNPEGDGKYQDEESSHTENCRLLDIVLTRKCYEYRRCYGNILYTWGMLGQRAEILKLQTEKPETNSEIGFSNVCGRCGESVRGPACRRSKCFAFTCAICNLSVRGGSNFCLACGHGGHSKHLMEWFRQYRFCPTGCGCVCLEYSGWT